MDHLKDHAFHEPDGYNLEVRPLNERGVLCQAGEKPVNPRLLLNVPADKMLLEVTQSQPPYFVLVCRADHELNALGLLEKGKDMIKSFTSTLNPVQHELVRGVKEANALLESQGRKLS